MQINSEFRKALGRRIIFGCLLFIITLIYILYAFLGNKESPINPLTVIVFMVFAFLIYASPDLFKICKLTITETGIEKTMAITGQKKFIPFETIYMIKKGKIKLQNRGGAAISDGFYFSTLILDNKENIIISPDHYENYKEIIMTIKNRAGFED
ncbi:hypothetical protein ACQKCJ_14830 [Flavobacterium sp. NPDC079362]|uniref:hypothetical protein n=1 Tax=Flavobacterium sp. NPDC079362 TaxID=3390566 RepID=UPI003D08DE8D